MPPTVTLIPPQHIHRLAIARRRDALEGDGVLYQCQQRIAARGKRIISELHQRGDPIAKGWSDEVSIGVFQGVYYDA